MKYLCSSELTHFGILGMKWGVRRTPEQLSRRQGKTSKPDSADRKSATKATSKGVKGMSNAELKNYIDRMNLEQQYKQLNAKNKSAGQKWVLDFMSSTSKQIAAEYAKKYAVKGIDALIRKAGGGS